MQTEIREQLLYKLQNLDETSGAFEALALDLFRYQAEYNPVYKRFLALLRRQPAEIHSITAIPALPISFFKTFDIKTGDWREKTIFTSSGTTGQIPSRHFVRDTDFYLKNALSGFRGFYGDPAEWTILALLPNYLERTGSSLVAMADFFIQRSASPQSGFFLHNFADLHDTLTNLPDKKNVLLLGVSFALLDFGEQYPMDLSGVTIMETGGMKGRRKELTRSELHQELHRLFQSDLVHSEYGMTEMMSQAYATGGEIFTPAPTLKMLTTEITDPFSPTLPGRSGVLNIIDLANIDSCCFIKTEDMGRVWPDGRFSVLGRLDDSEIRGCNLMAPQGDTFE